jgi:flagellar M-ring protein FliF
MTNDRSADSSFDIREFAIRKVPRMDFLNKSLAQVSELFRSMTPGARLTAGLLLAVVVVSMGYLFRQSAAGPDAFLFGGEALSDGQLNRVEAAIAEAGLSDFAREGNRIRVPAGQKAKYLAAVADGGALPPNFNTILEDALSKGGPWDSREQTRQRLKIARQQTLSEIVRAMPWVENAVVLYDERETRGLRTLSPYKSASASVSVKPIAGETLTPVRAKNIQKLVAHAVDMESGDVAVTDLGGGGYGAEGEITADAFPEGSMMHTKLAFESQKRDSIMRALSDIAGVRVEVSADFDTTIEETMSSVKPDQKTATLQETISDEKSSQTIADSGGAPGTRSQGPGRNANAPSPSQPQNQNETTNKKTETINKVGVETTSSRKEGFTLKGVWATVMVPSSYLESIWKLRNPTATDPPKPDDLRLVETEVRPKIENIVEPLLITKENKDKVENTWNHVRLVFLDLLPAPAIAPPSMTSTATSWLGRYWSTLAMLGVAMFSLLVLRSMVNGKPGDATTSMAANSRGLTLQTDELTATADETGEPPGDRPRLRLNKGKSLKDDLVEIVREDPDAAADILRSWIGKAG